VIIPNRDNAAILFLDLQEDIVKNSQTVKLQKLERAAGGLAKLAALLRVKQNLNDALIASPWSR
jgi:hypothetical protein